MQKEYTKDTYCKSEVLKLGFTEKLIVQLLPEPILKTNPYRKSGPPMKLWNIADVEDAMKSDTYLQYQEKSKKRREGAKKAVETKAAKLREEVSSKIEKIKVQLIPLSTLYKETLKEKSDWYEYQSMLRNYTNDYRDPNEADDLTKDRWAVNYIRHNLTQYDKELYEMSGKVGCHQEYSRYKKAVLTKISESYPALKDECIRQISRIENNE